MTGRCSSLYRISKELILIRVQSTPIDNRYLQKIPFKYYFHYKRFQATQFMIKCHLFKFFKHMLLRRRLNTVFFFKLDEILWIKEIKIWRINPKQLNFKKISNFLGPLVIQSKNICLSIFNWFWLSISDLFTFQTRSWGKINSFWNNYS